MFLKKFYDNIVEINLNVIEPSGKSGKQRTSILLKPVLEALDAHLNGQGRGYVFEGRDMGHISTRQIQRLLDEDAEKAGHQETRMVK